MRLTKFNKMNFLYFQVYCTMVASFYIRRVWITVSYLLDLHPKGGHDGTAGLTVPVFLTSSLCISSRINVVEECLINHSFFKRLWLDFLLQLFFCL